MSIYALCAGRWWDLGVVLGPGGAIRGLELQMGVVESHFMPHPGALVTAHGSRVTLDPVIPLARGSSNLKPLMAEQDGDT
jgi:hypothetical protein